ncbi:MAG: lipopolysaccharide biosynthesis protein, partial [Actinobacteria bacterium]|nr:lipopolysaccharide biosynthesis protein [Actinomycetota bacterium]
AEMAKEYGIEAFCYYHYWFGGKRILEGPFEDMLREKKLEFKFCLCWANQTWTGIWHGAPNKILIEQKYPGVEDIYKHYQCVSRAFKDPRYLKVDNKVLFVIYRPWDVPQLNNFIKIWRLLSEKDGIGEIYFIGILYPGDIVPDDNILDGFILTEIRPHKERLLNRVNRKIFSMIYRMLKRKLPSILFYEDLVSNGYISKISGVRNYPCLIPSWDNTPRSGTNGVVLHGSTPELFRKQVRSAVEANINERLEIRLIFIKSWNEWAEGNHLEPDLRFGKHYLEVLREEINK